MHRLYGMTLPILLATSALDGLSAPASAAWPTLRLDATSAIPTIPTVSPAPPVTNGIAVADDGTVYFSDSFNSTVWRLLPGGGLHAFVTGRAGRSLQVDAQGTLYGTDHPQRGRVTLWSADTSGLVTEMPRVSLGDSHNHTFVIGDRGEVIGWSGGGRRNGARLWRAEQHRQQLVAGSDWGFRDGHGAHARFFAIGSMTRTADGELIVTSGSTVRRIDALGTVTTIAAGDALLRPRQTLLGRLFGESESHLTGVAVTATGDIYVANSARGTLVRVGRDGLVRDVLLSDSGWTPTGVATSSDGSLYVLEYGAGVRVRRITEGTVQVVAQLRPPRAVANRAVAASLPRG